MQFYIIDDAIIIKNTDWGYPTGYLLTGTLPLRLMACLGIPVNIYFVADGGRGVLVGVDRDEMRQVHVVSNDSAAIYHYTNSMADIKTIADFCSDGKVYMCFLADMCIHHSAERPKPSFVLRQTKPKQNGQAGRPAAKE